MANPRRRPAPPSLNISNYSITAGGAIRRSVIVVPQNLNDVTINGWQLNPGVHQLGASSLLQREFILSPSFLRASNGRGPESRGGGWRSRWIVCRVRSDCLLRCHTTTDLSATFSKRCIKPLLTVVMFSSAIALWAFGLGHAPFLSNLPLSCFH
jgi:hypothetical protein